MKKVTANFKYSNLGNFLGFEFYVILMFWSIYALWCNSLMSIVLIVICGIVMSYVISLFWINSFLFYEDKLKIIYPTRIKSSIIEIDYHSIEHIRYRNLLSKAAPKCIIIEYLDGNKSKAWPSNSFNITKKEQIKELLFFVQSKGIKVIIDSKDPRDVNLLQK